MAVLSRQSLHVGLPFNPDELWIVIYFLYLLIPVLFRYPTFCAYNQIAFIIIPSFNYIKPT